MDIKQTNQATTYLNLFDIADSSRKEVHLSKILAYIIAKDKLALGAFLGLLDIDTIKRKDKDELLKSASVRIEKSRLDKSARTDIEIEIGITNPKTFIIVECKVKGGKATEWQFKKYEPIYNRQEYNGYDKYFVFLSHQSGINLLHSGGINLIDIAWRSVINAFWDECKSEEASVDLRDFVNYYERSYTMLNKREILLQDLADGNEIDRFGNFVYRREKVIGAPLYFAPYFTRGSKKSDEGIWEIARILGIITVQDIDWDKVRGKCERFAKLAYPKDEDEKHRETLLKKWEAGVVEKYESEKEKTLTYYFLDKPVSLKTPLLKKHRKDSKGWIGSMIGRNRCVTFADFLKNSDLVK